MKHFHQKNWTSIKVTGDDRIQFLQNLLSQDIHAIEIGDCSWGCLLNNKSKLIAFMGIRMQQDHVTVFVHQELQDPVMQTLEMYTIIQDVALSILNEPVYFVINDHGIICSNEPGGQEINADQFEQERIKLGFPLYAIDYQDPIPLEVPFMHQAISYTKGCYVGQETIARLYSRGMNVNKKLVQISSNNPFQKGDLLYYFEDEVGEVTSAIQNDGVTNGLGWLKRKGFDHKISVGIKKNEIIVKENI